MILLNNFTAAWKGSATVVGIITPLITSTLFGVVHAFATAQRSAY